MQMAYRSANTPPGYFSRPETHIHLDGGKVSAIERIMKEVEQRWKIPVKVDEIRRYVEGPQRDTLPELYGHHTPKKDGKEKFACFSTALLDQKRKGVRCAIFFMLKKGAQCPEEIVVEIEVPIGAMNAVGKWQESFLRKGKGLAARTLRDFEFITPPPDRSVEIHHKIDIQRPANEQENPIDMAHMMEAVGDPCDLGGLFEFEETAGHAIRSNSFVGPEALEALIREQQRHLRHYLDRMLIGRTYELSTLAESTLGLKHI